MILESFVVYQFGQAHFEPCKIWAGPDLMWTNYLGPQTALYRPAHWSSALTKNKKNKSLAKSFQTQYWSFFHSKLFRYLWSHKKSFENKYYYYHLMKEVELSLSFYSTHHCKKKKKKSYCTLHGQQRGLQCVVGQFTCFIYALYLCQHAHACCESSTIKITFLIVCRWLPTFPLISVQM